MTSIAGRSPRPRVLCLAALAALLVTAPAQAQWPQWGGPDRNFRIDGPGLATEWPEDGPKKMWTRDLGDGYSCILADGEHLYTLYRKGEEEAVVCLNAGTGETVWEFSYEQKHAAEAELSFGEGPNATPLIVGDRLFAAGINATISCLDKTTGKKIWIKDLMKEFEGTFLRFGYSSSPITHKDMIIVQLGGDGHSLVAMKRDDGSVVWKTESYKNAYSSPLLVNVDGQDQLIAFMDTHAVGVNPDTGEELWSHLHHEDGGCMSTPVWNDDQSLYLATGSGSRMLKLSQFEGETKIEEVWFNRRIKVGHTNVVRIGNILYATGTSPAAFLAFDAESGALVFRRRGFTKTNIVANSANQLVLLDENGRLMLVTPGEENMEIHGTAQVLENPCWTTPTLVGNRLYMRNKKTISGYELPVMKQG